MRRNRDSSSLIIGAARAEFAEHGYAGARVARIAARARVNKQLIFYYFGTKAGLYAAVTKAASAESLSTSENASPLEEFRAVLNRVASHLALHPELTTALADPEAGVSEGPGKRFLDQAAHRVTAAISRGQGMGYFRDDLDPDLAARQALVLLAGFHVLAPSLDNGHGTEPWEAAATDLLLRAFVW